MIADVLLPNQHETLARWARWERLGCPTTSNAAESIHGKLNDKLRTEKARTFWNQLQILRDFLWKRFLNRNSDKRKNRRSVNHYHAEMQEPGFREPTEEPEKSSWAFYRALHGWDARGTVWMPAKWVYPDVHGDTDRPFAFAQEDVDDRLPDGWKKDDRDLPEQREDPPPANAEADTPDHDLPLPAGWQAAARAGGRRIHLPDDNPHYNSNAWNLIHSIRRLLFKGHWADADCNRAVSYVFSSGGRRYPGDHVDVPEAVELAWLLDVLSHYNVVDVI
jgi:hypothetical protein